MRWAWFDERVGFLALLLAVAVAVQVTIVPAATAPRAPDALLGLAQLVWWALCHLVALTLAALVLRPPRG
jgi:cytochrome c biogenesis factor